jgi:translation initiation factor 2 subunit 3
VIIPNKPDMLECFLVKSFGALGWICGGNVVGKVGKMPKIFDRLMLTPILMQRVVGTESKKEVENLKLNEPMMLVVGTAPTVGIITRLHGNEIELTLKRPVVAEKGQRIAIGRNVENKWRLIGYAEI